MIDYKGTPTLYPVNRLTKHTAWDTIKKKNCKGREPLCAGVVNQSTYLEQPFGSRFFKGYRVTSQDQPTR